MRKSIYGLILLLSTKVMLASDGVVETMSKNANERIESGIKPGLLYEVFSFLESKDLKVLIKDFVSVALFRIASIIVLIFIGKRVIRITSNLLIRLEQIKKIEKSLIVFIVSVYKVLSYLILISIAFRILGINEASLATILGAAGVGIGFAAKDILGNFAGGLIILMFKPYKISDFIDIDGKNGEVQGISIFATEMNTVDNKKIIVPNGKIITTSIINYTANKVRRVEIEFGISYKSDFRKAIKLLSEISSNHDKVLQQIEKTIRVKSLSDSSVIILYRIWCKKEDYWDVYYDSIELAKDMFEREGIEIPFPQMDVHLKREESKDIE